MHLIHRLFNQWTLKTPLMMVPAGAHICYAFRLWSGCFPDWIGLSLTFISFAVKQFDCCPIFFCALQQLHCCSYITPIADFSEIMKFWKKQIVEISLLN